MTTEAERAAKVAAARAAGYAVEIAPFDGRATVTWRGRTIADSNKAILLRETRHKPVVYFPRTDALMAHFDRTSHQTHCPFKGDASYFSLVDGAHRAENAVWSYEQPISEAAGIQGHLAFYTREMGADFGIEVHTFARTLLTPL
jgi:uncharacterized protein (DUF427 family)